MSKFKFIFLLIGFIILIQCVVHTSSIEKPYVSSIFGQTDNVLDVKADKNVYIKNLYSGSINIIEKYLTIYMILFIFSYYIRSTCIRI